VKQRVGVTVLPPKFISHLGRSHHHAPMTPLVRWNALDPMKHPKLPPLSPHYSYLLQLEENRYHAAIRAIE